MKPATPMLVLSILLLAACRGKPPEHPELDSVQWRSYANEAIGFRMTIPDCYSVQEDTGAPDVIFRSDGYPVMMVTLLGKDRADRRGLWADHEPVATEMLDGRPANRYEYDHHDGPFIMHTLSWVMPWRGQFLELALRTEASVPDALQQRMLDSFELHGLN
jgi:hypothetical protein